MYRTCTEHVQNTNGLVLIKVVQQNIRMYGSLENNEIAIINENCSK